MYRAMRTEVTAALREALAALGAPREDLGLEDPPDDVEAVLASSVAFRLAEPMAAPPPEIAEQVAERIDGGELAYIARVESAGPYINFLPADAYFDETVAAAADASYGRLDDRAERVVVEHTSANPTGPVHVGRARNPIIGDAIARILDYAGYDVERHYYVNDAGRQMAVFTWAYETFDETDLPEPAREKPDYEFVRYYRKGNEYLEQADAAAVEAAEAKIAAIMQGLEAGEEAVYQRVNAVVEPVLSGMQQTLARLPATFDEFVRETRFIRNGQTDEIIERLQAQPAAEQADGAWQLDLEDADIDKELVFVRSDGTSLYLTRDLAHHEWKLEEFDRAVTVLGEDHELQARQLRAALDRLGADVDRLEQVLYSYVNLPDGGMSTRQGTGIDLDDLLDEAVDRARQEIEDRRADRLRDDELTRTDMDRIADTIGIGAVRFDIVAKQASKGITFEWDRALDFEAQSAPYLQYVHARCCGIMAQADGEPPSAPPRGRLNDPAERDLIRVLARFPAVIDGAAADLEPHRVATYARELAETFNVFYRECPVTGEDVPAQTRAARLALVAGSRNTMANALDVLGVEAPESM